MIYLSSPNRTPKGNGYRCAEMRVSIQWVSRDVSEHCSRLVVKRCIFLPSYRGTQRLCPCCYNYWPNKISLHAGVAELNRCIYGTVVIDNHYC